uniref:helix-turn-helix domain-containing protein n=1 Tax=Phaeacidiphilus oryzae TaxID=348818 RepID=UPI002AFFCCFA|nr:helix-turn-helix domain-containing protein [Phaeacidiphilus oryzae]
MIPALCPGHAVCAGRRVDACQQEKREAVRLEAARRFEAGAGTAQVAAELRVTDRSVRRWRRPGGAGAWRRWPRPGRCRWSGSRRLSGGGWRRS